MKQKNSALRLPAAWPGILVLLVLAISPGAALPVLAQGGIDARTYDLPKVLPHEFRGDVRNLPQVPSKPKLETDLREPVDSKPLLPGEAVSSPNLALAPAPVASQNFAGLSRSSSCTGGTCGAGIPPDTNGDVGPRHYIQAVNSAFAIYNKSGTLLASFTENSLWSGSGNNPCNGNSVGDPVVLYDSQADRWILTNLGFAFDRFGNPLAPFYECIAVSKTGDPVSGGWWLYPLRTDTGHSGQPPAGTLNDYPKFGIWTDCLYYSANGFDSNGSYVGGEFASFSRAAMYAGSGLTGALGFKASSFDYFTMIPSNLSAPTTKGLPPAGTPNYYVQESTTAFNFRVRKFTVGTNCGSGTLSSPTLVSQASYIFPGTPTTEGIVPQPGTSIQLDSLGDRVMQKVQYRRVGAAESLWVTHTFRSSSSGPTGLQWVQINVTGGTISATPVQQQLFNPGDGIYRWMGSIAADRDGNVAIAYSTSNGSSPNFPGIAYAGRLASDPPNTLPRTEQKLVSGAAAQTNNCGGAPCDRWGDYSSVSVDPADGCTFWFTSEYYTSQANGNSGSWSTRIGSFRFPSCGQKTFYSNATQDGWVLESGALTNVGGSLSSTATTFNLGDDALNRQYRAVLSFDTSGLPDNAVITSAVLKIKQAGLPTGSNPFNSLGNIVVDIRTGAFNNNVALELVDFQATASHNAVMRISNNPAGGWYSQSLGAAYLPLISRTGTTQFRLRFALGDNNNHVADILSFYSGNYAATPSFRPTLVIHYNVP